IVLVSPHQFVFRVVDSIAIKMSIAVALLASPYLRRDLTDPWWGFSRPKDLITLPPDWVCSKVLLKQRNLAAQLSDPCADPNLSVVCLRLLHQGGEQLANGIVSTKASGGEWGMAFAQCEHVCAPFNQERDHFGAPLHARNMQGGV